MVNGGLLGEHQGINLPGVRLRVPAMTPKDLDDLAFALRCGVNYIGVSFVRRPEDVLTAKAVIERAGKKTPVIAKLEKPEAIDNLEAILKVADGVMVARGDLGVEMSPERVPVVQKTVIARAREARVPVITATQMLESMTEHPRPTRAEASDVANAVFDGSDAVMLSAETATGRYPVESVQMMDRIIRAAEASVTDYQRPHRQDLATLPEATAELICHASEELSMKVIAVFTESGATARLISKHRPRPPIIAFSGNQDTRRRDLSPILGRAAAEIASGAGHRRYGRPHGKTVTRRKIGQTWRLGRHCGKDAAGRRRHDELHEVSHHRRRHIREALARDLLHPAANLPNDLGARGARHDACACKLQTCGARACGSSQ